MPQPGQSHPLGATVRHNGVNFAVFSQRATALELLLFDDASDPKPTHVLHFDPVVNRTFYYWHMFVPDLLPGQVYALRADGPFEPDQGHRFDHNKVLIDPYARSILTGLYRREAACRPGDNLAESLRCAVVDPSTYDWQGDTPLRGSRQRHVVYEMHVGGFTSHPTSGLASSLRGTYAGLIEKIPYLKELGVNTVELLPVHQFDAQDAPNGLTNYWGYSPIGFFAPHSEYSSKRDPLGPVNEFRDMVRALHRAGIAVWLDVVYNHTTENDAQGPNLCYRGLENVAYYIPDKDPSTYANYSGCGNTLNANHSIVRRMIMDSLRYWVTEMHVDGFRFDLASAMSRGEFGEPLQSPPILWEIESDPVLSATTIVAEAWDAAGLYQVGSFIGDRFAEWNGHFRDDVRSFVKSDPGLSLDLSLRIVGSPDLYPRSDRHIRRSINYITAHDGFTLNDLVSYNEKHNQDNLEHGRDGGNDNRSWNCGAEGPTNDPAINALREQQIKNFLTQLIFAQGTPMLLMGDEVQRTQRGNNNAFAQNNEISWFDWSDVSEHATVLRFTRLLLRLQADLRALHIPHYLSLDPSPTGASIAFHGTKLNRPEWETDARWLAFTLSNPADEETIHVIYNAFWEPLNFELPKPPRGRRWRVVIDTSLPSPQDISSPADAPVHAGASYLAPSRSSIVLIAAK